MVRTKGRMGGKYVVEVMLDVRLNKHRKKAGAGRDYRWRPDRLDTVRLAAEDHCLGSVTHVARSVALS